MKKPNDPPEGKPTPRSAARVILRDGNGSVLLIRYAVQDYVFWTTPGGAIEPGETAHQAATRELWEELHLNADLEGPVHTATGRFHHEGRYVENTDTFFTARIDNAATSTYAVTAFEADSMQEARWWSAEEIDQTTQNVFPRDLAAVLRRLQAADQ